jgi:hypothetical protein
MRLMREAIRHFRASREKGRIILKTDLEVSLEMN